MLGGFDGDGYGGHQNGGGLEHMGDAGSHGGSEGSAVFISNLQWWTTDVELEALCATFGHVLGIRFLDDKACGKSRGMAIVEFAEGEAAAACIAGLSGRDVNGRPCRVSHQQQRNQVGASTSGQYGGGRGMGSSAAGSGGGRGPSGRGGRSGTMGGRGGTMGGRGGGSSMEDMGGGTEMMMGVAGGMIAPGGMLMMPGMMGMGMPGVSMEMMQGMMMMPGMMPFGMPGMPAGFKPPPPPGGPPKME